jgi:hypothetical protein
MSQMGQTQKSGRATGKSALPSRTDIVSLACQVRKVPLTDSCAAANTISNRQFFYRAGAKLAGI